MEEEIKKQFNVNDILNLEELHQPYELTNDATNKYPSTSYVDHKQALIDIKVFTEAMKDILLCPIAEKDAHSLEDFRVFDRNFLRDRGVFYSEGISTINRFPALRNSSIPMTVNDTWEERYMFPIKLPNGDVFTWMGWTHQAGRAKYQIPYLPWIKQGDMLGNLDSLNMYDGRDIYVCEGYTDALRINESMNQKSVANLGSNIYKVKAMMLRYLKSKGHRLLYVPDLDEAGTGKVLENDLWDDIICFDGEKDVDKFFRVLKDKAKLDETARNKLLRYKTEIPERKIILKQK